MGRTRATTIPMEDDPLARAMAPPADEGPDARAARERAEALAKKRSDEIDGRLRAERDARRKRGPPVKVLLLGQSESGKSTTLKNFQLTYARKAWSEEREAWRVVIQFNLVRSVNTIADAVARELTANVDESGLEADRASILTMLTAEHEPEPEPERRAPTPSFALSDAHRDLLVRLSVLRAVQRSLELKLGSAAEEDDGNLISNDQAPGSSIPKAANPTLSPSSFRDITNGPSPSAGPSVPPGTGGHLRTRKSQEFFVHSNGWKNAIQRLRPRLGTRHSREASVEDRDGMTIASVRGAMKALWADPVVRDIVKTRRVKLLDTAEFFLNDLDRVAGAQYTPSDDDIIRARLRTVGVQEHSIILETGSEVGREWMIYDVGGSRSLRAQWPAYFDDMNAIIFLAPISCFDERLLEDVRVNRLDDSLQLWKFVCSNKLLARAELVLFLNKCDLLDRKLKSGVRFVDFVRMYGNSENEATTVQKFLRMKFKEICVHYSKQVRGLHIHFTSVVDTKATAQTLGAVQDGILRTNLHHLDLI
ncbi:hypothetical protein M0805_004540 [Coniferiporia weirii]|nr:hypothetical protein M0805_004540 [Coniferiporia weirii]